MAELAKSYKAFLVLKKAEFIFCQMPLLQHLCWDMFLEIKERAKCLDLQEQNKNHRCKDEVFISSYKYMHFSVNRFSSYIIVI